MPRCRRGLRAGVSAPASVKAGGRGLRVWRTGRARWRPAALRGGVVDASVCTHDAPVRFIGSRGCASRPRGRLATPPARRPISGAQPREPRARCHTAAASAVSGGQSPGPGLTAGSRADVPRGRWGSARRPRIVRSRASRAPVVAAALRARALHRSAPHDAPRTRDAAAGAGLDPTRTPRSAGRPHVSSPNRIGAGRATHRLRLPSTWPIARRRPVRVGICRLASRQRVGGDVVCLRRRVVLEDDRRGF